MLKRVEQDTASTSAAKSNSRGYVVCCQGPLVAVADMYGWEHLGTINMAAIRPYQPDRPGRWGRGCG